MKSSENVSKSKPGLLAKILFRLYKPQMLALSVMPHNDLEPQSRFNEDRFEFAFYDKKGMAWYKMKDGKQFPVVRELYAANAYTKLLSGIRDQDIRLSLNGIKTALFEINPQSKKTQPNIARIGYICEALLARQGTIISHELLNELTACYFIREDEAIEVVNDNILKEKIQTISEEGELAKDLFFSKGLFDLFPFLSNMDGMFDEVLHICHQELTAYTKELNSYIDGRRSPNQIQS